MTENQDQGRGVLVDVSDVPLVDLFAADDGSALAHAVRRAAADAEEPEGRLVSAFNSAIR